MLQPSARLVLVIAALLAGASFAQPALHDVVREGSVEDVRAAIQAGANLEVRDVLGGTPLMAAAGFNANPDVVRLLLDAGANVEARSENGSTPLMLAARYNTNPAVLRVLVDAGANIEARTGGGGMTPLMWAAGRNENPAVLLVLLDAGAKRGSDRRVRPPSG